MSFNRPSQISTAKNKCCSQKVFVEGYIPPEMWFDMITFCYSLLLTSGDSPGLSAEGFTGHVLIILTEFIALMVWASIVAGCAYSSCRDDGNY